MEFDTPQSELLGLFLFTTFAVALFFGCGSRAIGRKSVLKPDWAPRSWLYNFFWTVAYFLCGISAFFVRINGGIWESNVRALIVYASLQIMLALFWTLTWARWFWSASAVLFIAFVVAAVVAFQFFAFTQMGAIYIGVVCLWLAYALALHCAIALRNSGEALRKIVRDSSPAVRMHEQRKERLMREVSAVQEV